MKEASSDPDIARPRADPQGEADAPRHHTASGADGLALPVTQPAALDAQHHRNDANLNIPKGAASPDAASLSNSSKPSRSEKPAHVDGVDTSHGQSLPVASAQDAQQGLDVANAENPDGSPKKKKTLREYFDTFWRTSLQIITHSWLNVLLVFVPLGIITAEIDGIHGGIVFAMNCIAVVPLAGLLAYATESVASEMGDALGALLNVTFGNAVELIIFIALTKNQIRIVQASLLGSILSNLLLILGMGFFLGGLRYREQIYNSTVTQMSACLLSLSVISLVLPTAFHASFSDPHLADAQSLKISRGTSVILLLVYVIYLMFQLKSHAYLYESTPQHIVDAEAVPGPAAGWLDSSSSEDSSSSSSDSDDSNSSRDTVRKRMKKVLRGRRRRKSSIISQDTNGEPRTRSSSFATNNTTPQDELASQPPFVKVPGLAGSSSTMEKDDEVVEEDASYKPHKKGRRHHRKHRKSKKRVADDGSVNVNAPNLDSTTSKHMGRDNGEPRRVDFAIQNAGANGNNESTNNDSGVGGNPRNPFLRGISVKNLAPTVFVQKPELDEPVAGPSGPVPRVRYGIRRTNSLPDRLRNHQHIRPPGAMMPAHIPLMALTGGTGAEPAKKEEAGELHLSRTASIILLLVSTGLVALCAEFLIGSIEEVVETSSIGEIFIGLIILPIVGNAAEHVTAITVAMKNKMDLAIGVAVGSSIQIAIFVTPLVVILGWIMDRDMTLYFTLFETVCLFVSAFMVNFLVLDGRSNYLEGALLCAVYLIIAVVAFFYPDGADASSWGE